MKKYLSFIIAIAMVMALLPAFAWAADDVEVAKWTFSNSPAGTTKSGENVASMSDVVRSNGTVLTYYTGGGAGGAAWAEGQALEFSFASTGYEDLHITFKVQSSNTGVRDAALQVKIAGVWEDVQVVAPIPTASPQVGHDVDADLPAAVNNSANVELRVVVASGYAPNGGAIGNTGTFRITGPILITSAGEEVVCTHVWGAYAEKTPGNCVTNAVESKCCTLCGAEDPTSIQDGAKDADKHESGVYAKDFVAATALATGYSGDTYCSACDAIIDHGVVTGRLVASNEYVLTDFSQIAATDSVVVVVTKDSVMYALPHDKGSSSIPLANFVVTETSGKLNGTIAADICWNIVPATGGYNIQPEGAATWLYSGNGNSNVRVGTSTVGNVWILGGDGYLQSNESTRRLGVYLTQDFRTYTTLQANIQNQTTTFYKKSAGGSASGDPCCDHVGCTDLDCGVTKCLGGSCECTCCYTAPQPTVPAPTTLGAQAKYDGSAIRFGANINLAALQSAIAVNDTLEFGFYIRSAANYTGSTAGMHRIEVSPVGNPIVWLSAYAAATTGAQLKTAMYGNVADTSAATGLRIYSTDDGGTASITFAVVVTLTPELKSTDWVFIPFVKINGNEATGTALTRSWEGVIAAAGTP